MNYADYEVRKVEVFNRDDGRCQMCGFLMWSVKEAHIHHIIKRSIEKDDRAENLLTLCPTCHGKHHTENP